MKFIKKNLKYIIIAAVGLVLILIGFLAWELYFSKYDIFAKQEKKFLETVERYYEFNSNQLPKKNETREMTLQDLYDGSHIEALYIPKTRKLCDTSSWVRVYKNDNEEYEYTTYLKCGKFESDVDHEGPEITLNGDEKIVISLGSEYQELGVNKVVDKQEGNIDTKEVVIDSSNINTSKIGTYKVTYTVRDKAYNKTVVTRKVVVARNLTEVVKTNTDDSNLYKGLVDNNYIQFSGMLWRIIGLDSEGNVRIVTQNNIANLSYGNEGVNFDNSNIKEWLNNYFYSKISDKSYLKTDNNWCMDYVKDIKKLSNQCSLNNVISSVGLLTIQDYQNSKLQNNTYLNSITEYWLLDRKDARFAYIHSIFNKDTIDTNDSTNLSGVRPVLVLKKDLYLLSGKGTLDNPYNIGDYNQGKTNDLLNTRLIGEHVSYFGMSFRISDIDSDGNVKLVSTGYLSNNTTNKFIYSSYNNQNSVMKFNPKEEGNIGYQLNNEHLDYIDDSLIIAHEFVLPTYSSSKKYSEFETSIFKTKISIPATYEMFSATNEQMIGQANYWLLDYVDENKALIINSSNGRTFNVYPESQYKSNGFKIVFYVNKNVKIKGGNGTSLNPYEIK